MKMKSDKQTLKHNLKTFCTKFRFRKHNLLL